MRLISPLHPTRQSRVFVTCALVIRNILQSHRSERTRFGRNLFLLIAIAGLLGSLTLLKFSRPASADTTTSVSISSFGTPVTQNFDSLVSSGTGTLPGNTPAGWGFSESSTNANTTYTAGTGSGNAGDTYSFGSAAAPTDRALGQLRSGSLIWQKSGQSERRMRTQRAK